MPKKSRLSRHNYSKEEVTGTLLKVAQKEQHPEWRREDFFDSNATTFPPECVVNAVVRGCVDMGNPSSVRHRAGQEAHSAHEASRAKFARVMNVEPSEVIFTSGATESNNTLIRGVVSRWWTKHNETLEKRTPPVSDPAAMSGRFRQAWARVEQRRIHAVQMQFQQQHNEEGLDCPAGRCAVTAPRPHVITSTGEHPSVLRVLEALEDEGQVELTKVRLTPQGLVDPTAVAAEVRPNTVLVTVIHAQGEMGSINDVQGIAKAVRTRNRHTVIHSDCTQSAGKLDMDPWAMGLDTFSASGHKLYGPKGIGALVVRGCAQSDVFDPMLKGGPQENEHRAGTENTSGAAGMAEAFAFYAQDRPKHTARLRAMRDRIERGLIREGMLKRRFGPTNEASRMPHTLMVALSDQPEFCNSKTVQMVSDEARFCIAAGSACSTLSKKASPIHEDLGSTPADRSSAVRISCSIYNTPKSCDRLVAGIAKVVRSGRCVK
jgi:cysteine desulfurase